MNRYRSSFSHRKPITALALLFIVLFVPGLAANDADFNRDTDYAQVERVRMELRSDGRWNIHVTVRHNDQGWNHYADRWQVLDDDTGEVLAERILAHPHDTEQPFTRSLTATALPTGSRRFRIRASCPNHGFGGRELLVDVPGDADRGVFNIIRE